MSKYEKLDSAILNKIGGHPVRFASIHVRDVREETERIAAAEGGERGAERVLDGRLQALRRAGKIRHDGKGWVRVQVRS